MKCRIGCGACCIAPSISSPIPGMPKGKKAGERCVQLNAENHCQLFGLTERPLVCSTLQAEPLFCGESSEQALALITQWELITRS